ncbi:G-protein coupled receptor 176 [Grus japonensis]|uniref:G-protein coupled receptor 176 n=1 Tax=Grus japonensis TaxID=30415 RepID=A0ABC9WYL6_GRUJA
MGYGKSWISRNESEHVPYQAVTRALEMRNASAGQMVWQGGNGSGASAVEGEEHGEEQTYRHFTTTVQIVIFIGSLLGPQVYDFKFSVGF